MTTALLDLPAPYLCRPLTLDDAQAVTDLMAACEEVDVGEVLIELEDIQGDWQRPSFDLATQSVGVWEGDGRLVAYAEVYQGRRAEAMVHPEARGQGIGSALMEWTWRTARAHGGSWVGQSVPQRCPSAVRLFETHGYEPRWTSWILEMPEGAQIADGPLPDGVRLRSLVPGQDEHAAYRTVEDAFSEWPNRDPESFEDWAAGVLNRPGFEPWQMLLAVEDDPDSPSGDDVVGAVFVIPSGEVGWVQYLAVRRDRRGRGLARALLVAAFGETRRRGLPRAELATDSRTGALDLYLHVGMRVKHAFVHYGREIDEQAG